MRGGLPTWYCQERGEGLAAPTSPWDPYTVFKRQLLTLIESVVPVSGSCLYVVDRELNARNHVLDRLDPRSLPIYLNYFHRLDPFHPRRFSGTGKSVVATEDLLSLRALERSDYYRGFMRPLGMYYEVELFVWDEEHIIGGISLIRNKLTGGFGRVEVALLRKIKPFVDYSFSIFCRNRRLDRARLAQCFGLSAREVNVIELVLAGWTNAEIARNLAISVPTVKTHLQHIFAKVGVRARTGLFGLVR